MPQSSSPPKQFLMASLTPLFGALCNGVDAMRDESRQDSHALRDITQKLADNQDRIAQKFYANMKADLQKGRDCQVGIEEELSALKDQNITRLNAIADDLKSSKADAVTQYQSLASKLQEISQASLMVRSRVPSELLAGRKRGREEDVEGTPPISLLAHESFRPQLYPQRVSAPTQTISTVNATIYDAQKASMDASRATTGSADKAGLDDAESPRTLRAETVRDFSPESDNSGSSAIPGKLLGSTKPAAVPNSKLVGGFVAEGDSGDEDEDDVPLRTLRHKVAATTAPIGKLTRAETDLWRSEWVSKNRPGTLDAYAREKRAGALKTAKVNGSEAREAARKSLNTTAVQNADGDDEDIQYSPELKRPRLGPSLQNVVNFLKPKPMKRFHGNKPIRTSSAHRTRSISLKNSDNTTTVVETKESAHTPAANQYGDGDEDMEDATDPASTLAAPEPKKRPKPTKSAPSKTRNPQKAEKAALPDLKTKTVKPVATTTATVPVTSKDPATPVNATKAAVLAAALSLGAPSVARAGKSPSGSDEYADLLAKFNPRK
ncbi:hypothetical protein B0A49_03700 [Cryomyces minteri]|uniref:Inhibitor of growth protein N-terminal histone-binding domain-containing protein n=1 Tax=Cryomyces minteri TaxID=331657 RepID=A0A4V5NIG7_9PEZI|nr:hypothetical protein B0A49_03700 [Cryomyces minteri]